MKNWLCITVFCIYAFGVCAQGPCDTTEIADNEKFNESVRKKAVNYIEGHIDTICIDGRKYFFRFSPIVLKKGYTALLNCEERNTTTIYIERFWGFDPVAPKGYHLTWLVRNDSLLIRELTPEYDLKRIFPDDTASRNVRKIRLPETSPYKKSLSGGFAA
ncbi:MAG: hypothetical protein LBL04_02910, partial [Bacteroidales bacterium]|nr:hypothetical protein [Bacteroidales bacterium]